jgi:multidrug resistance efflux pump
VNLQGKADGVPPFSPILPDKAARNFNKIVQRLPDKVVMTSCPHLAKLPRIGFSVETTIHMGLENVVDE